MLRWHAGSVRSWAVADLERAEQRGVAVISESNLARVKRGTRIDKLVGRAICAVS